MKKLMQENKTQLKHRVITKLNREEMEFMDKLGKDALFSTGHKLTYSEILRGLIDFAMETGISGNKLDSFKGLKEKLLKKMQNEFRANNTNKEA